VSGEVEEQLTRVLVGWATGSARWPWAPCSRCRRAPCLATAAWLLRDGRWRGDGVAVAVQGAFLLALDLATARRLRD
jgi:hypothetical protein